MSAMPAERQWIAEDFLDWESQQELKHELINGAVFALTGVSRAHNTIARNLIIMLTNLLELKDCDVFFSDIRVQVDEVSTFTYPDVVVVCGEAKFRKDVKPDTLVNPLLIFEILSPSTELIDRNRKFDQYLQMDSLGSYFLVSQDKPRVEVFQRHDEGWLYQDWTGMDTKVEIASLECELALEEVFQKVEFAPETE